MAGLGPIWPPPFLHTASAWSILDPTMQHWLVEPLGLCVHQPLDCPCHHHQARACPPLQGRPASYLSRGPAAASLHSLVYTGRTSMSTEERVGRPRSSRGRWEMGAPRQTERHRFPLFLCKVQQFCKYKHFSDGSLPLVDFQNTYFGWVLSSFKIVLEGWE